MKTADTILKHFEDWVAVVAFATVSIVTFANVVGRYVLNASLAFTTELAVNMAVLLALIGSAIAMRENAHLGFTLVRDYTKGKLHIAVVAFVTVAICTFFGIVFWYGLQQGLNQFSTNRVTPALQIPQGLFTMSLPLGAGLGILRALHVGWADIRDTLADPSRSHALGDAPVSGIDEGPAVKNGGADHG